MTRWILPWRSRRGRSRDDKPSRFGDWMMLLLAVGGAAWIGFTVWLVATTP